MADGLDARGHSRRRFIQRSGLFALAVPLGLAQIGCGSDGTGATSATSSSGGGNGSSGWKFLNSFDEKNNDFWISWAQGSREAAEAVGLEYSEAVSGYDVAKQRSVFENAATQGVNGALMLATDEGASPALITSLTQADIKVVNTWNNAPWSTPFDIGPNYVQLLSANNFLGAKSAAEALIKKMGGTGNLVHIEGVRGLSHDTERTLGLDAALAANPGVRLIARQPGKYNRVDGQSVMENIINGGKKIDGVFCQNDDAAVGVIQALKQVGGTMPPVVGIDGIAEMMDLIESGEAYATWAVTPRYAAGLATIKVFDALQGWNPRVPERMMGWGSLVIDTPEAAAAYKDVAFAKKSPWDWRKMSITLNPDDWDTQNPVVPTEPDVFWARRKGEMPKGYSVPKEYAEAKKAREFEAVRKEYLAHMKTDPLAKVKDLTTSKQYILAQ